MRLQRLGVNEADLVPARIGLQDPRDLFHVIERSTSSIGVRGTGRHREIDATAIGQTAALHDLVTQALTLMMVANREVWQSEGSPRSTVPPLILRRIVPESPFYAVRIIGRSIRQSYRLLTIGIRDMAWSQAECQRLHAESGIERGVLNRGTLGVRSPADRL